MATANAASVVVEKKLVSFLEGKNDDRNHELVRNAIDELTERGERSV